MIDSSVYCFSYFSCLVPNQKRTGSFFVLLPLLCFSLISHTSIRSPAFIHFYVNRRWREYIILNAHAQTTCLPLFKFTANVDRMSFICDVILAKWRATYFQIKSNSINVYRRFRMCFLVPIWCRRMARPGLQHQQEKSANTRQTAGCLVWFLTKEIVMWNIIQKRLHADSKDGLVRIRTEKEFRGKENVSVSTWYKMPGNYMDLNTDCWL